MIKDLDITKNRLNLKSCSCFNNSVHERKRIEDLIPNNKPTPSSTLIPNKNKTTPVSTLVPNITLSNITFSNQALDNGIDSTITEKIRMQHRGSPFGKSYLWAKTKKHPFS
jgi:hypothetical protein